MSRDAGVGEIMAIWIGRYQPFHRGHSDLLEESLIQLPDHGHVIGVSCSSEPSSDVRPDPKHSVAYNPFNAWERFSFISIYVAAHGHSGRVDVVMVPRNSVDGDRLDYYLPSHRIRCCTNKDEEDIAKAARWRARGEATFMLDVRGKHVLTSSEVRRELAAGSDWRHFIDESLHEYFMDIDGARRLRHSTLQG